MSVRCLVADDHPALVQAVVDFLRSSGVDVVATCGDGDQAVALARETQPDVAVVDFRMPRLAGIELLRRLHETAPDTRLVVYTADADEADVRGSLATGAKGVVLKDAPLADLLRAITTVVAGSSYVDASLGFGEGPPELTERESAVLALLAEGLSHDEIGARLSISGETVRTHVRKACDRLGAATRTEAVAKALRQGLIA